MLQQTKPCSLGNERAMLFRYNFTCLVHLFNFDGCIFDKSSVSKTGCLHREWGMLEDRQDCCISAFIKRQQANAAQNCWEALPYCIMKHHGCINVWYHRVQQEISGVQHQRCRRRKQSQSYSSRPLQKHPNLCSQELYALVLTPQDDNPSDHILMHNRAQLLFFGLIMAELHRNISSQGTVTSAQTFYRR